MNKADSVVDVLTQAEFVDLGSAIAVAGVEFEFARVLAGPSDSLQLVVILGGATNEVEMRRIAGLARALDFVGSRRSLTVISLSKLSALERDSLARSARVLTVDGDVTADLAILLPLELPVVSEGTVDAFAELRSSSAFTRTEREALDVFQKAATDQERVRTRLRTWILESLGSE